MAADRFNALTHAAEAIAFPDGDILAIIMDDEATMGTIGDEAKSAGGGVGVTNDVGDGLAEGKRKSGLFVGGQKIRDGSSVSFHENSDSGGLEGGVRLRSQQ